MTGNVSLAFLKAYLLQKINVLALGTTESLHLHLNWTPNLSASS